MSFVCCLTPHSVIFQLCDRCMKNLDQTLTTALCSALCTEHSNHHSFFLLRQLKYNAQMILSVFKKQQKLQRIQDYKKCSSICLFFQGYSQEDHVSQLPRLPCKNPSSGQSGYSWKCSCCAGKWYLCLSLLSHPPYFIADQLDWCLLIFDKIIFLLWPQHIMLGV